MTYQNSQFILLVLSADNQRGMRPANFVKDLNLWESPESPHVACEVANLLLLLLSVWVVAKRWPGSVGLWGAVTWGALNGNGCPVTISIHSTVMSCSMFVPISPMGVFVDAYFVLHEAHEELQVINDHIISLLFVLCCVCACVGQTRCENGMVLL